MDIDRDNLDNREDADEYVDEPMPAYEDEATKLRQRQQSFKDEVARTKAKLAEMPRGWETRGGSGREWDDSSEGLTPQRVAALPARALLCLQT